MAKKVLIISASFRKNGNSETLAKSFEDGAKANGNQTDFISLAGKKIAFCTGCMACRNADKCIINDDAVSIAEKMCEADVICFSTPIYYYEMSGQLKTMLDRANPLFYKNYKFREIYLTSTVADEEDQTDANAVSGIKGWVECFPKTKFCGKVFCGGVDGVGDIKGNIALTEAFNMGKSV